MLPHRVTETLDRVRHIEASLQASESPATPVPAVSPGEVYAGYSASDLPLFDLFSHARPKPTPEFVTDFLGTRTRTSSLWDAARTHSRAIEGDIIATLSATDWVPENEKPTRFRFDASRPSIELMTEVDGVQVWRNARLVAAHRARRTAGRCRRVLRGIPSCLRPSARTAPLEAGQSSGREAS